MPDAEWRWERTFEPEDEEASLARRHAVHALATTTGVDKPTISAAQLVVAELAANAVRHARSAFTVVLVLRDGVLRIEVHDLDPRPPVLVAQRQGVDGGFGLHLVAWVAERWGWQEERIVGKVVWAEIVDTPTLA